MKKFLLTSAFSAMILFASAQYDEGRLLVNGGLGFSSITNNTTWDQVTNGEAEDLPDVSVSSSNFILNARGYYFISDNFAVGLGIGYGSSSTEASFEGGEFDDTNSIAVEPLNMLMFIPTVRYYIPIERELSFFLQGDIEFGFGLGDNSVSMGGMSMENSTSVFGVGIEPGLSYMISRKFALEMTFGRLGFTQVTNNVEFSADSDNSSKIESSTSEFGLNLDSSTLTFGFSMLLN